MGFQGTTQAIGRHVRRSGGYWGTCIAGGQYAAAHRYTPSVCEPASVGLGNPLHQPCSRLKAAEGLTAVELLESLLGSFTGLPHGVTAVGAAAWCPSCATAAATDATAGCQFTRGLAPPTGPRPAPRARAGAGAPPQPPRARTPPRHETPASGRAAPCGGLAAARIACGGDADPTARCPSGCCACACHRGWHGGCWEQGQEQCAQGAAPPLVCTSRHPAVCGRVRAS